MEIVIKEIVNSKYNNSKLAIFEFKGENQHFVITNKTLFYLKITNFEVGQKVFILKTFGKDKKPIWLPKRILD